MLRRTTAVFTAALVLGAVAAPAALAKGPSHKGGKKPVGTVASFDGTTLTVTMKDGSSETAVVAEDTKVKIDHRGRPAAKGNPTRGDLDDLVEGTLVLRMKTDDGELEKIRIRRAAAPAPADEDDAEESDEDAEESDEDDAEEADEADEADEDESEDEESDEGSEEEQEEEEEETDPVDEVIEDLPLP